MVEQSVFPELRWDRPRGHLGASRDPAFPLPLILLKVRLAVLDQMASIARKPFPLPLILLKVRLAVPDQTASIARKAFPLPLILLKVRGAGKQWPRPG